MLRKILIFTLIFTLGAGFGYAYFNSHQKAASAPQAEKNTPKAFIGEVYDKIKDNYWNNISDAELLDLFKLASGKSFKNKENLLAEITDVKEATAVANLVLSTLAPAGRSGLYTQKQEVALKNVVENRNPETGKVEPTIFTKLIGSNILYLQFKKFSPTSLDEFQKAFEQYKDNAGLNSLILDLRGNIGGAIDATAYFLGFFLGKNQYAFDFYHKGEYLPFKTPTDKLSSIQKYKQVVVLVDQATQSSAEMMAASMKKYHIGVVVGVPTKGWGSVERVFKLDNQMSEREKYSIFLVHSITLRDDNQPIEGRGVDPDVNVKSPDWEQQLFSYFKNQPLIEAIKSIL